MQWRHLALRTSDETLIFIRIVKLCINLELPISITILQTIWNFNQDNIAVYIIVINITMYRYKQGLNRLSGFFIKVFIMKSML